MSGRRSLAVVRLPQAQGLAATKISRAWTPEWLSDRDLLIVKADQREPLVVLRTSLAAEIAKGPSSS
jgi:hypothetical protein